VHEAEAGRADAVQADAFGRLDLGEQTLPDDADYYVCGPLGFMSAQIQTLKTRGIPAKRIHAEAFGTGGPGH
jgi:nitric oxide dioxygenase